MCIRDRHYRDPGPDRQQRNGARHADPPVSLEGIRTERNHRQDESQDDESQQVPQIAKYLPDEHQVAERYEFLLQDQQRLVGRRLLLFGGFFPFRFQAVGIALLPGRALQVRDNLCLLYTSRCV